MLGPEEGIAAHEAGSIAVDRRIRIERLEIVGYRFAEGQPAPGTEYFTGFHETGDAVDHKRNHASAMVSDYLELGEFDEQTELTGYMKLRLWVQADGSDDMDLFVAIEKIDRAGNLVPFLFFGNHDDGPVALGWLRVSHRELAEVESTPYQPVHKHAREIKLKPGEVVPVEIEIWPTSVLFEKGEKLRIVVQASDIYN